MDELWSVGLPRQRWLVIGDTYIRTEHVVAVAAEGDGAIVLTSTGQAFGTTSSVAGVMAILGVKKPGEGSS